MEYTTAQINAIIDGYPASVVSKIIEEYIHDSRNQDIAKRKILRNEAYEPLSESVGLTPRQCFNIVKKARKIIVRHLTE